MTEAVMTLTAAGPERRTADLPGADAREAEEIFALLDRWLAHGEWGESHPLYTEFTHRKTEWLARRRAARTGETDAA